MAKNTQEYKKRTDGSRGPTKSLENMNYGYL